MKARTPEQLKQAILLSTVVRETGCWEWQRTRNNNGYGRISVNGRWRNR